jgi:hypothetical protein
LFAIACICFTVSLVKVSLLNKDIYSITNSINKRVKEKEKEKKEKRKIKEVRGEEKEESEDRERKRIKEKKKVTWQLI